MVAIAGSSADAAIGRRAHRHLHLRRQMAKEIRVGCLVPFPLPTLLVISPESKVISIDFCLFSSFSSEEKLVEEGQRAKEEEDKEKEEEEKEKRGKEKKKEEKGKGMMMEKERKEEEKEKERKGMKMEKKRKEGEKGKLGKGGIASIATDTSNVFIR